MNSLILRQKITLTVIRAGVIGIGLSALLAVDFRHQKAHANQLEPSHMTQPRIHVNPNMNVKEDNDGWLHQSFIVERRDSDHVRAGTAIDKSAGKGKNVISNRSLKGEPDNDLWLSIFEITEHPDFLSDWMFKDGPETLRVLKPGETSTLTGITAQKIKSRRTLANASPALPAPLFSEIQQLETVITPSGDAADIFVPLRAKSDPSAKPFPVALLLQGANVDKSHYSEYAKVVASYGFVVVIPNNLRLLPLPPPAPTTTGYYPELKLINEVWTFIKDPTVSPVAEVINPEQLVLLGHSLGGAAGLNAVQGGCAIPKCLYGEFKQPEALIAAVFYGTHLKPYTGDPVPPINNETIPTALIFGEKDGRSFPEKTKETYQQLGNPLKVLVSITGANHFGITNSNAPKNPVNTPAVVPAIIQDPKVQDLSQALAIQTIGTWTALFLRATVLEDPMALDVIFSGAGDKVDDNVNVLMQGPTP